MNARREVAHRAWAVLALIAAAAALAAAQVNPVVEWTRQHAIRLETVEAGHGFADMQPLKKVIGDARIVALGEATHGTREFFQLKHRMLEFLASEMGFTIFSIEANMPEAYRLNDFVLEGKGDPAQLLAGMYFWTWNTEEVLDMIRWMREFNKSGKGRVQFTGFDMQTPTVAVQIVRDFAAKAEPEYAANLAGAAEMALAQPKYNPPPPAFGVATARIPATGITGKRIRFSGYIKTEGVTSEYAGLWCRVDGQGKMLLLDNMRERGVKGTTDWQSYEIELPVAAEATDIYFGAILPGNGTAWFDSFRIDVDGKPYSAGSDVDLDFESPSVKGFFTGGNGYKVEIDNEVFHTGKQSLRMKQVAAAPALPMSMPVYENAKQAASAWKDIVRHLDASRAGYVKKGVTERDVEWGIQNARVVLQCMQMRANQVSRDQSMADNVKWILDQNPNAKIVLWAHNGHVTVAGSEPMGAWLRKMYGDQMVVFGFAFNQGSFQAIEMGKGLRDFTVPPAAAASLDATLAAARIPRFALDLRQTPSSGAVGEWFAQPHKTRSIGAVFSDGDGDRYILNTRIPTAFDAMLFIESTTAARKNPAVPASNAQMPRVSFIITHPSDENAGAAAREYRDPDYGVSFRLPVEWQVDQAFRWGDKETTVVFTGAQTRASLYFRVFRSPVRASSEEMQRTLASYVEAKAAQRRTAPGAPDYRLRPNSCQPRSAGGLSALTCIADFTRDGQIMAEYLTYVINENAVALFFAPMPAAELDGFRERFEPIVKTLRLP